MSSDYSLAINNGSNMIKLEVLYLEKENNMKKSLIQKKRQKHWTL